MLKWEVVGDELILTDVSGNIYPSAEQVYESIIEKKQVFSEVVSGPPSNLNWLTYSRYPLTLAIHIDYKPADCASGLLCEVKAEVEDNDVVVEEFQSRKTDHIVIDNKWYPFAVGSVAELTSLLDDVGITHTGEISFKSYLALKIIAQDNDLVRDSKSGQIVHPGITVGRGREALGCFVGSLYPYQEDGWRWLSFLFQEGLGGILADEMGLGKTVQIIAALSCPDRTVVSPSLIIAPSTLLENWRREIDKFSPLLRTSVHQGPQRTGLPAKLTENDVVIASYDTVVRDGALFDMVEWKAVVLDEAQAIKNPDTRRALSVKTLKRSIAIAVTGTPVENKLRDLWSIVDFVLPGYLGSEVDFESRFGGDPNSGCSVEPFVSPIMLRRRISEVAKDLPERIDVPQVLQLDESEAGRYDDIRKEIFNTHGKSASLVALTTLRMYCAHPFLLESESTPCDSPSYFSKLKRLLEILEEIIENHEKVLVFASYNKMSDMIADEVRKRFGTFVGIIDGRTPVGERQNIVDKFSSVEGPALLALNPRAAGTGLNITAANHVIHYNLEWNPAIEDQASARAYRRGQDKPVTVHRLFYANTVEDIIDQRLQRKRHLAESAVVGVTAKEEEYKDILAALQCSPLSR